MKQSAEKCLRRPVQIYSEQSLLFTLNIFQRDSFLIMTLSSMWGTSSTCNSHLCDGSFTIIFLQSGTLYHTTRSNSHDSFFHNAAAIWPQCSDPQTPDLYEFLHPCLPMISLLSSVSHTVQNKHFWRDYLLSHIVTYMYTSDTLRSYEVKRFSTVLFKNCIMDTAGTFFITSLSQNC